MNEIDKERVKITKRKKTEKYKIKRLKVNTKRKLFLICKILSLTLRSYYDTYRETDTERLMMLQGI